MKRLIIFLFALVIVTGPVTTDRATAQSQLDGRDKIFRDELLENLVGDWKLTRKIRGKVVETTAKVEWVLNHQFLRIHMMDDPNPPVYEAMVFIGYDNASERYVAHWLDNFGGRFSETLGYGTRNGTAIKFVFEYPDGPFQNTFTWNTAAKEWTFLGQQKDESGKWSVFAEDTLRRP